MALAKNTAAKAPAAPKDAAPKTAPKVSTPAAKKPAAEAPVKEVKPNTVAKDAAPKIGRKELALSMRAKVTTAGCAISPKVAEICTIAYEESIAEALASGQEVHLPGFGKFVAIQKEAAEKRNPKTGVVCVVPAHKQVKFRPGTAFKNGVNTDDPEGGSED